MQYIVGFNGPPKSGKDTVANMLRFLMDQECEIPTHLDHLARPMRQMAMSLVGLNPEDFQLYNEVKDAPQALLRLAAKGDNDSLRKLMIATSEDFIKPKYGQDFWGRKLIDDHKWIQQGYPGVLIVPDIGFPAEVNAFDSMRDKVPALHTLIVQLDRPNVGWAGDSRVQCEGINTINVVNASEPIDAARIVLDRMRLLEWNLYCGA